jgi:hypothetical protein
MNLMIQNFSVDDVFCKNSFNKIKTWAELFWRNLITCSFLKKTNV